MGPCGGRLSGCRGARVHPDAVLIEFDTDRLRLRQWRASDRAPFATLNTDPCVMRYFPAPLTRAGSDAMADRCQELIAQQGWGLWAVQRRDLGEFIGFVGLHVPRPELPCSPCIEIGWRLSARHWGQGFATEAARGALRVGFELLHLDEIVSFTAQGNDRSRAVMGRLRMLEDRHTFEHPSVPRHTGLRTHCLYRLSRGRYTACLRQPHPT